MFWLIIILLAYSLLAVTALGDKYLLSGPPNARIYSFYVGILGILVLFLIPFVDFSVPDILTLLLSLLAGVIFIFALLGFYSGLEKFEASRIVPAIGGLTPLFTFGLAYCFYGKEALLPVRGIMSFLLLIAGSVLVTYKDRKTFFPKSLKISVVSAFLFALSFVLTKYVYLSQSFWNGFIWIRMGGLLAALGFIFTKDIKREIFTRQFSFRKKTGVLFLANQALGSGAAILQNWAIALASISYLAVINALQGVQYVLLFVFATLLSLKSPRILKEEISKRVLLQKIIAILLIGAGLALLAL